MKRDMDLIRSLLLKLESFPAEWGSIVILRQDNEELQIDGYTPAQIGYHISLIVEAGLINTAGSGTLLGHTFQRLSWEGHDFLDSVRDDEVWERTRKGAASAGGFTLDLLKDLAKGFVKKKIEEHTGVEL